MQRGIRLSYLSRDPSANVKLTEGKGEKKSALGAAEAAGSSVAESREFRFHVILSSA